MLYGWQFQATVVVPRRGEARTGMQAGRCCGALLMGGGVGRPVIQG